MSEESGPRPAGGFRIGRFDGRSLGLDPLDVVVVVDHLFLQ
jgi:hypothetical protein